MFTNNAQDNSIWYFPFILYEFIQLYDSKKVEHTEAMAKSKLQAEDLANNNDVIDEKPVEKTIFIDRIMKLALEDKVFSEQNVLDELKTVLLAVSKPMHFFRIFIFNALQFKVNVLLVIFIYTGLRDNSHGGYKYMCIACHLSGYTREIIWRDSKCFARSKYGCDSRGHKKYAIFRCIY